jgi:hypothetical protein
MMRTIANSARRWQYSKRFAESQNKNGSFAQKWTGHKDCGSLKQQRPLA